MNMKKAFIYLFLILTSFNYTSNSHAGVYLENMYKGCAKWNDFQKNENISFADGEFTNMMMCKTYILGWSMSGNASNVVNENSSNSVIGCKTRGNFNNNPEPKIVSRLFIKYLDDNPKKFSEGIDVVMYSVLNEAYPCD